MFDVSICFCMWRCLDGLWKVWCVGCVVLWMYLCVAYISGTLCDLMLAWFFGCVCILDVWMKCVGCSDELFAMFGCVGCVC